MLNIYIQKKIHDIYLEIDKEDNNTEIHKSMRCRNEISLLI